MKHYAIRDVSELTGIKPVTLRAWQRRYGLIQPERTESGHRVYTEANLERIKAIQSWLAKGVAIGKVKALIEGGTEPEQVQDNSLVTDAEGLLQALSMLNKGKAESIVSRVFKEYPLEIVQGQFFYPVIEMIERIKGPQRSLQRGLLQSVMIAQLSRMLEAENRAGKGQKALVVSLDGSGSLAGWISAIQLAEQGYLVTFIDGAEDISGLNDMLQSAPFVRVHLFSNKALQAKVVTAIERLLETCQTEVSCSEMINTLHLSIS